MKKAHELAAKIDHPNVVVYDKNKGLVDFAHSLACVDLFIAGSTGPLHLSSAFNVPTIGFYPNSRSFSASSLETNLTMQINILLSVRQKGKTK